MKRGTLHNSHGENGKPGHIYAAYDHEAATRHGTEVHSKRTKKICVSYTISEDLSGDRGNQILSRISKKKSDSREVRLRIRDSNADRWGLKTSAGARPDDNGGAASSDTGSVLSTQQVLDANTETGHGVITRRGVGPNHLQFYIDS